MDLPGDEFRSPRFVVGPVSAGHTARWEDLPTATMVIC